MYFCYVERFYYRQRKIEKRDKAVREGSFVGGGFKTEAGYGGVYIGGQTRFRKSNQCVSSSTE
jgi:hypothetical protein